MMNNEIKHNIEKQFQNNKQIKKDGLHNIIREVKDAYSDLGIQYNNDDILSALVSVYGFRADQLVGVKLWDVGPAM